jgi:hypothetical protein
MIMKHLPDHGLPLVQLRERRRDLIVAMQNRRTPVSEWEMMQIAAVQQAISAFEDVIADLDVEMEGAAQSSTSPPLAQANFSFSKTVPAGMSVRLLAPRRRRRFRAIAARGSQFIVGFFEYDKRGHVQIDGKAVTLAGRVTLTGSRYSGSGVTLINGLAAAWLPASRNRWQLGDTNSRLLRHSWPPRVRVRDAHREPRDGVGEIDRPWRTTDNSRSCGISLVEGACADAADSLATLLHSTRAV